MTAFEWIGIAVFFVLIIGYKIWRKFFTGRHIRNIKSAARILAKLATIGNNGAKLNYLRKVDPFVFEELILTALKNQGHKIKRNKRYTGDGGIDGRVRIDGAKYLVQAKRYKSYISAADVLIFEQLCAKHKRYGLFVHTGKTGQKSKAVASSNRIKIISGSRLLELLTPPKQEI